MYSNKAIFACLLAFHILRQINSAFSVSKKASTTALS